MMSTRSRPVIVSERLVGLLPEVLLAIEAEWRSHTLADPSIRESLRAAHQALGEIQDAVSR